MVKKEVIRQIDYIVKEIWKNNIKNDYLDEYALGEDSLKCCIYYHLRRKLSKILVENNLRIYTEYTFPELGYRADIVIVEVVEKDVSHLKDEVEEIVAVFELKYISTSDKATVDWVKADIEKIKSYIKKGNMQSQFYFCVIYEVECWWLNWMDKRATNNWANGLVTELNAGYIDEIMKFEVHSYNNMNKELDG